MGMKEAKAKLDAAAAAAKDGKGEETSGDDIDLKRKTRPPEDDGKDIEVSLEEDDDDNDGDAAGEPDTGGKSRADKKRERGRGFAAERDAEREAAQRERERADRLEATLLEVTRRSLPEKDKQEDPLAKELKDVDDRLEGLAERAAALGAKITPEQEKVIKEEARALRRKEAAIHFKMEAREARDEEIRRTGGITPEVRAQQLALKTSLETEFRDVYTLTRTAPDGTVYWPALSHAKGEYEKRRQGRAMDLKLLRECLKDAEREFGLGNTRDVSDGQRAKFSGVPRGGHGGGRGDAPRSFTMTAEHRRMANAMFKHVKNEGERFKLYAKRIGSKIQEKAAAK